MRRLTKEIVLVQPYDLTWEEPYIDRFIPCSYADWDVEQVRLAAELHDADVIFPCAKAPPGSDTTCVGG